MFEAEIKIVRIVKCPSQRYIKFEHNTVKQLSYIADCLYA